VPTWLYEFRVAGPRKSEHVELGAYHGADTDILFGASSTGPPYQLGSAQQHAAETLRGYVANFLKSGDPNGSGLPRWPQHSEKTRAQHLEFDDEPGPARGLRETACQFWRERSWDALPGF
jgi:para-nitrobenzyl esterase